MNLKYRKTIIAGNWKMNLNAEEAKKFITQLKTKAAKAKWCDVVLCVPAQSPVDGAVMLVEHNQHRYLRKVKKLADYTILLQSYDREYDAQTVQLNECNFLGRCVRIEITL